MSEKKKNLDTLERELSHKNFNNELKNDQNCKIYNNDIDTEFKFNKSSRNIIENNNNLNKINIKVKEDDIYKTINNSSDQVNNIQVYDNIQNNTINYVINNMDNTKRKNLDTSTYTNNPTKIQGRGFGDINNYGMLLNGIGESTRQNNIETNPRNVEDNRIYVMQHNNYNGQRVTENLACGSDTRYLNKKMI